MANYTWEFTDERLEEIRKDPRGAGIAKAEVGRLIDSFVELKKMKSQTAVERQQIREIGEKVRYIAEYKFIGDPWREFCNVVTEEKVRSLISKFKEQNPDCIIRLRMEPSGSAND